jgi:hypothetical protein
MLQTAARSFEGDTHYHMPRMGQSLENLIKKSCMVLEVLIIIFEVDSGKPNY